MLSMTSKEAGTGELFSACPNEGVVEPATQGGSMHGCMRNRRLLAADTLSHAAPWAFL